LNIYLKALKTYQVIIFNEDGRSDQDQSIARKYMNRFTIEEDDQFEIHVKDYTNKWRLTNEDMYNAIKEVMLKARQGSG